MLERTSAYTIDHYPVGRARRPVSFQPGADIEGFKEDGKQLKFENVLRSISVALLTSNRQVDCSKVEIVTVIWLGVAISTDTRVALSTG